jgi:hypothetical protein
VDLSKIRHIPEFVITHYFRVITKYSTISPFEDSETSATFVYHRPTAHGVKATQSVFMGWVVCGRTLTTILDRIFRKLFGQ